MQFAFRYEEVNEQGETQRIVQKRIVVGIRDLNQSHNDKASSPVNSNDKLSRERQPNAPPTTSSSPINEHYNSEMVPESNKSLVITAALGIVVGLLVGPLLGYYLAAIILSSLYSLNIIIFVIGRLGVRINLWAPFKLEKILHVKPLFKNWRKIGIVAINKGGQKIIAANPAWIRGLPRPLQDWLIIKPEIHYLQRYGWKGDLLVHLFVVPIYTMVGIGAFFYWLISTKQIAHEQVIAAHVLINSIKDETSMKKFKEVYELLDHNYIYGGAPQAIYDVLFKNTNMELRVANNISLAAEIFEIEFILAYQEWDVNYGYGPGARMPINFATGDTPWIAYRKIADTIDTWFSTETQVRLYQLRKMGIDIDPTRKPDMSRVIAFPLDAVFPQKRTDYHSFVNILNNMWERLHIPVVQRNFFYGDLILDGDEIRQMTDGEYEALLADIHKRKDLMVIEFLEGSLVKTDPQYKFLMAMDQQAKEMSVKLEALGGPFIFISGIGPSYEGKGHIGFMEEGIGFQTTAFIGYAGHYIAAGHAKENGGYKNVSSGHGYVTFGYADLLRRKEVMVLVISTGNNKSHSNLMAIEGAFERDFPEYPAVGLQKSKGFFITEHSAAGELRISEHPWDFGLLEAHDWTDEMVKKFFIRVAQEQVVEKDIESLTMTKYLERAGNIHPIIHKILEYNLSTLTQEKTWEERRESVVRSILDSIILPKNIFKKLGWTGKQKRKIVIINPHLDDEYLAMMVLIKIFTAAGHQVSAYYTAKGSTAVDNDYVKAILDRITTWNQKKIAQVSHRSHVAIMRQLIPILEGQNLHTDPLDYDVWSHMGEKEKDLRAQALYLEINQHMMEGSLTNPEIIKEKVEFINHAIDSKERWGARDITIVEDMRTTIRIDEAKTALMSLGLKYEDIHEPMDSSWYTQEGRGGTAKEGDIDLIKEIFQKSKPDLIISNGEGFPDYSAHSTTEVTVIAAILDLFEEGELDHEKLKYLTYAGVWERIETEDTDVSLVLSADQMNEFSIKFRQHYPSQAPAPVPDSGYAQSIFFSDAVLINSKITKNEIRELVPLFPADIQKVIGKKGSGVLNYRLPDLSKIIVRRNLISKTLELKQVREDVEKASNQEINGPAPLPHLFTKYKVSEIIDILRPIGHEALVNLFNGYMCQNCLIHFLEQIGHGEEANKIIEAAVSDPANLGSIKVIPVKGGHDIVLINAQFALDHLNIELSSQIFVKETDQKYVFDVVTQDEMKASDQKGLIMLENVPAPHNAWLGIQISKTEKFPEIARFIDQRMTKSNDSKLENGIDSDANANNDQSSSPVFEPITADNVRVLLLQEQALAVKQKVPDASVVARGPFVSLPLSLSPIAPIVIIKNMVPPNRRSKDTKPIGSTDKDE